MLYTYPIAVKGRYRLSHSFLISVSFLHIVKVVAVRSEYAGHFCRWSQHNSVCSMWSSWHSSYIKKHDIYLSYNWVDVKYNNPLPGVLHDGTDTNSEKQLYVFFSVKLANECLWNKNDEFYIHVHSHENCLRLLFDAKLCIKTKPCLQF
jgi:hypothetical protein